MGTVDMVEKYLWKCDMGELSLIKRMIEEIEYKKHKKILEEIRNERNRFR